MPCIEKVAEPDAGVIFLVHHPVSGFKWLQAYCGIAQCGLEKTLAVRRMMESYSFRTRMQLAQRRAHRWAICSALRASRRAPSRVAKAGLSASAS